MTLPLDIDCPRCGAAGDCLDNRIVGAQPIERPHRERVLRARQLSRATELLSELAFEDVPEREEVEMFARFGDDLDRATAIEALELLRLARVPGYGDEP